MGQCSERALLESLGASCPTGTWGHQKGQLRPILTSCYAGRPNQISFFGSAEEPFWWQMSYGLKQQG